MGILTWTAPVGAQLTKGFNFVWEQVIPPKVSEPDIRVYPVGYSTMVLNEAQVCKSEHCRTEVANHSGGNQAFAVDRNGFKWKCANRHQLNLKGGEAKDKQSWACVSLECFNKAGNDEGQMTDGFSFAADCKRPNVIVTVDGEIVPDAPEDAEDYKGIEQLQKPLSKDELHKEEIESASPWVAPPTWLGRRDSQRRQKPRWKEPCANFL
mmetsp:Transcript_28312/g.51102  ORF Transcript_28312/g.51102 Transcript_28312/m.51102 type:complete len:209 (+) Transcript_28312:42-668(+)